jgi:FKBP-type peptidyl-prolyl cis-trans isomerase
MRTALIWAAALVLLAAPANATDEKADEPEGKTVTTASGLVITELRAGTGDHPTRNSIVEVHYHGTLENGKVFDSSVERGQPARFPLRRVIPCWTEGVQLMRVGGKSRLVCPPEIAYGQRGAPPRIAPNATLRFEVELLAIVR